MSAADKLPKNQSAEVHVDGIPLFAGEISAVLEQAEVAPLARDITAVPADIRKKVDKLPRLRRWVKRVEDLEKATG